MEPLVSLLIFWHSTDVCRLRFQPSASMPGSNDPVGTLQVVPAWLHDRIVSEVSPFVFWRLADVYSLDLGSST